jgi:GTP cyclohydrolase I
VNKVMITWEDVYNLTFDLFIKINREKYKNVFPVMKNGLVIAERLSHLLNTPISYVLTKGSLVVDDLIDSGKTLDQYPNNDKAVLFVKNNNESKVDYYVEKKNDWIVFPWEKEDDIQDNIVRILEYIGEDPNREGLMETPKRVVKSWKELFAGYNQDPKKLIKVFEDGSCDEMVILKDIEFYSLCEHHMLPFFGKINVAYVPNGKVIGVSKIARLVDIYARRLQIQERLTQQIAEFLYKELNAKGVMVTCEAIHFCMVSRGIKKQNSKMITSAIKGVFEENEVRQEFLNLIKDSR